MSSEYGVRDDGRFEKKDIADIRNDMRRHVKDELGDDISLRQNSPIQQLIDALAIEVSRQWDAAEDSYFASFYEDATGEQLDKQLALAGFSREPLRPAEGEVIFSRDAPATRDITIPEGTVVTTEQTEVRPPIPFETTESATLFSGNAETDPVPVKALAPWQTTLDEQWLGEETNVEANTIVRFEDPISGIDSVTNPEPTGVAGDPDFQEGRDRETDSEFKLRYDNTLAEGGTATLPAIESDIFRSDERVRGVRVEEIRDAELGYGPRVTVFAPELENDDLIAQAILESRAAGMESFGSASGVAVTETGREIVENFERAERTPIAINVEITVSDFYPDDGDKRITESLIQFIGGEDSDGLLFPGLDIGERVVFDQVKKRVMEVRGVVQSDIEIGIVGESLSDENIPVGEFEVAQTAIDDIDVTVIENV